MRGLLITGVVLGAIVPVAMSEDVPDVSGTRTGPWTLSSSSGTVTLTVKQDGSAVTGDIALRVDLKGRGNYSSGSHLGDRDRLGRLHQGF